MTARASVLLKSRASPDMLPFSLCTKKRLAIRHMSRPLFPTTLSIPSYDIGKFVGAKDLSAPRRSNFACWYFNQTASLSRDVHDRDLMLCVHMYVCICSHAVLVLTYLFTKPRHLKDTDVAYFTRLKQDGMTKVNERK